MSSSEAENFDIDNVSASDSEDYAPVVKKPVSFQLSLCVYQRSTQWQQSKAPAKPKPSPKVAKPARPKANAVKSKVAVKKKVLADHDDNAEDSAMDVDADEEISDEDESGPSVPKGPVNEKKKTASETYTKVRSRRFR